MPSATPRSHITVVTKTLMVMLISLLDGFDRVETEEGTHNGNTN